MQMDERKSNMDRVDKSGRNDETYGLDKSYERNINGYGDSHRRLGGRRKMCRLS